MNIVFGQADLSDIDELLRSLTALKLVIVLLTLLSVGTLIQRVIIK